MAMLCPGEGSDHTVQPFVKLKRMNCFLFIPFGEYSMAPTASSAGTRCRSSGSTVPRDLQKVQARHSRDGEPRGNKGHPPTHPRAQ